MDNLSLRILDLGVVERGLAARLRGWLRGTDSDQHDRAGVLVARTPGGHPDRGRTGSPACTDRCGGTPRWRRPPASSLAVGRRRPSRHCRSLALSTVSDTTPADLHDAAGGRAADPARLRRHPLPVPPVRARAPARPDRSARAPAHLIVGAGDAGVALAYELEPHRRRSRRRVVVGFVDDDLRSSAVRSGALRCSGPRRRPRHDLPRPRDRPHPDRAARRGRRAHAGDRRPCAAHRRAGEGAAARHPTGSAVRWCAACATSTSPTSSAASTRPSTRARSPSTSKARRSWSPARAARSAARSPARSPGTSPAASSCSTATRASCTTRVVGPLDNAEPVLADIRDERPAPRALRAPPARRRVPRRRPQARADPRAAPGRGGAAPTCSARGRWRRTAAEHGCDRFVHISTDKAADPCSVMGATQARRRADRARGRRRTTGSRSSAVRFGNVLGSRGSVVPTFFRQIVEGGPVTVTDPEMTRYFMTIPEAVSLVLQAGAMADERKVFVLDMGEPVSIIEPRPPDDPPRRPPPRRRHRDRDHRRPSRRAAPRAAPRRRRDRRADPAPVDLRPHPEDRRRTRRRLLYFLDVLARSCCRRRADQVVVGLLDRDAPSACGVDVPPRRHEDRPAERPPSDAADRADLGRRRRPRHGRPMAATARPGAARRPARVRARPAVRAARPARRSNGSCGGSSRRTTRGMLTNGPLVAELEERIAERLGVAHVVARQLVHVGADADAAGAHRRPARPGRAAELHVLGIGARGRVERPRARGSSSADPATFQIDLEHAAASARRCQRAILATHVFGAPCDPRAGRSASASERGIPVVFDAAHALGAFADGGRSARSATPRSSASRPRRSLVAGEGGLVATNDAALAETAAHRTRLRQPRRLQHAFRRA